MAHQRCGEISPKVEAVLTNALEDVFVSVVSIWEIQVKHQLGKVAFAVPLEEVVQEQLYVNKLTLLGVNLNHIYALNHFSLHHRDPFDRLLLAQAHANDYTFISHDSKLSLYPVPILW